MKYSKIVYFEKKLVESEIREMENLLEAAAIESERKWLKERLEEYERKLKQLDAFREWYLLNDFDATEQR